MDTRIGRSGGIRTHGIHIPNVARYQLRYTPIFLSSVFYCRAWRASGCHVSRCGGLGAALHRSHGCPALPPRCFRRWRRSAACTNCATPRYSFLLFFTAARGALPVAMCRAAAALARPCIARMAAQHFRLAVSAAGGARLRAPTALHPDIPFFCFLLPRVARFRLPCVALRRPWRGGCARRAHETLRVLFIIGKKQPRVKQNA